MSHVSIVIIFVGVLFFVSCGNGGSTGRIGSSSNPSATFKKIELVEINQSGSGDVGASFFDDNCPTGYLGLRGGLTRHPDTGSGAVDWVLQANMEYRRSDGVTVIGTTDAGAVFTFPLTNSFGPVAGNYYTGLASDWTSASTINCDDWGSMADDRSYGDALATDAASINAGVHNCGTTGPADHIACVEQ